MGPRTSVALGEISPRGAGLTTGFARGRPRPSRAGCPARGGSRGGEIARSLQGPRGRVASLPSGRRRVRHVTVRGAVHGGAATGLPGMQGRAQAIALGLPRRLWGPTCLPASAGRPRTQCRTPSEGTLLPAASSADDSPPRSARMSRAWGIGAGAIADN